MSKQKGATVFQSVSTQTPFCGRDILLQKDVCADIDWDALGPYCLECSHLLPFFISNRVLSCSLM